MVFCCGRDRTRGQRQRQRRVNVVVVAVVVVGGGEADGGGSQEEKFLSLSRMCVVGGKERKGTISGGGLSTR